MKIDVLGLKQTLLYAQETFAATNGRNRHMSNWLTSGNDIHPEQTEIIMYQTEDGLTKIDVRMENETVWLTQAQMAELFQRERSGITKHIKNVFAEGEVDEKSNVKNIHIANSDKPVAYYSLDVIISVGYRVKSLRGTQFRIWANSILKEYLIKGFAMNDELLKQAGGGNYFDELMDRIRDIRSSEKVFWRKVLDIYATSVDYDPRTESSVLFFKTVQNKMHWAAHGKTAKSILVTASVRLAAFIFPQYAAMMQTDEMDFASLGERKRAIFCIIPVNDGSMNYLVSMLLTQCFQQLYLRSDERYNGRLPVPVRVIQDEWANVAQPDSYPKVLATCRSYNIGINIIVQNIHSIKALYKDEWESVIGNCDTLLFLGGGNEPTSLEFISKLLGKETVHTRTRGQTKGRSGSSSVNFQQTGRDLMTPDEIRMLPSDDALLLIRGEKPVRDKKYDIRRHHNVQRTTDGGAEPYIHNPPVPDYSLPDLPYAFRTLDDFTFLEDEHEEN